MTAFVEKRKPDWKDEQMLKPNLFLKRLHARNAKFITVIFAVMGSIL